MFKMGWWLLIKTVLKRSLQDISLVSRTVRSAQWYQEYSFKLHYCFFFHLSFFLLFIVLFSICCTLPSPSLPFTFAISSLVSSTNFFHQSTHDPKHSLYNHLGHLFLFPKSFFFLFLLETADKVVGDNNQINLSKNLLLSFGCWH